MSARTFLSSLVLAAGLVIGAVTVPMGFAPPAMAQEAKVSFDLFFTDLQPLGLWVSNDKYNYVWCPKVDADWRPYTRGHWVYVRNRGWYFQSDEPFAWAVYHYGRWIDDSDLGWCWVPGTHWAPAWVSWRRSKDYIGWAPLPPDNDGFAINITINVTEPPEHDWVFVPVRSFVEPELRTRIVFADQHPEAYTGTRYEGPVKVENNTVINTVIALDFIKQATGQDVKIVDPKPVKDPVAVTTAPAGGVTINVFNPTLELPKGKVAPPQVTNKDQAKTELAKQRPPKGTAPGEQPVTGGANPAPAPTPPPAGPKPVPPLTPPAATSSEPSAPSSEPSAPAANPAGKPPQPQPCPKGEERVNGKCVPSKPATTTAPPAKGAPATGNGSTTVTPPVSTPPPNPGAAPAGNQGSPNGQKPKCRADQQLVDGKCVPKVKGGAMSSEPANPPTAPVPAPSHEAAPGAAGAPAGQPPKCTADQQLLNGKCVPIPKGQVKPSEPPKTPSQPPESQAAPNPPTDQGKGKPIKCKPGFELVKGKCLPIPSSAEQPAQ